MRERERDRENTTRSLFLSIMGKEWYSLKKKIYISDLISFVSEKKVNIIHI